MENNAEEDTLANISQDSNGNGALADDESSQAVKPLVPQSLFGGSAALLKETDDIPTIAEEPEDVARLSEASNAEEKSDDLNLELSDETKPESETDVKADLAAANEKVEEQVPVESAEKEEVKSTPGRRQSARRSVAAVFTPPKSSSRAKKPISTPATIVEEDENGAHNDLPTEAAEKQDEVEEEEKPSTARRQSARRSTAASAKKAEEKTPTATPKTSSRGKKEVETPAMGRSLRSRQSLSSKKTAEEPTSSFAVSTPATSRRSRRSNATAVIEEDEVEQPVEEPAEQHSDSDEAEKEEEEEVPKSARSRRGKQTPSAKQAVVEEPTSSKATPKSSARAKKPTTPSSKGRGRKSRQSDIVINLDKDDPFNFDAQVNNHPEPLTNLKVQKQTFGDMKFTLNRSPADVENRYANTEKAAAKNTFPTVPQFLSPTVRPKSITALTTTPKVQKELEASAARSNRKRASKAKTPDVFEPTSEKAEKTPRRKKRESSPVNPLPQKPKIEFPELGAADQLAVDFTNEPHPSGTRVFALWGNEFYPAIVFDRDGLGRYKVIYTQDQENRDVPLTGIITLSALKVGNEVSVTAVSEGEEVMKFVRITRAPSQTDPDEWVEGLYEVEHIDDESDEKKTSTYKWTQFFIGKAQQKDIVGNLKNQAVIVDEGNAVPRSARRSRLAANAIDYADLNRSRPQSTRKRKVTEDNEVAEPSTVAVETPKKRTRKASVGSAKKKATPKRSPVKEQVESAAEEEEEEEKMEVDLNGDGETASLNKLFDGCYFILTSSARRLDAGQFNKREYKNLVEELGGVVAEEISELQELPEGSKAFLIADRYYRTHKYLFALAASIPCLHFKWLTVCSESKKLVDYEPYLLKAGSSVVNNQEYDWQPLKGKLFKGKTIFVHSAISDAGPHIVQFDQIWRPLLELLGAKVLTCDKSDANEVVEFCNENTFDFMLTDRNCHQEVLDSVGAKDIPIVSSNWIIHAIVTNEIVEVGTHPSFSPDQ